MLLITMIRYNPIMAITFPVRVVLDTNVIFEGLTNQGGACGLVIDSWRSGLLQACVSNTLAYEYEDVLSRKLGANRWLQTKAVLGSLLAQHSIFVEIYFSWRPASPDPGDDHVINCAMSANAPVITSNLRDFEQARQILGLQLMTPTALINHLVS